MTDEATYPHDIPNVQEGLKKLSQRDCLVALDELYSRRGHNHKDLVYAVHINRMDRVAWRDARDERERRKEEAEE